MFMALGIPWIFESIHYVAHVHPLPPDECYSALEMFFRLMEFLYFSRGIFIFIIFVFKKPVLDKLKKTFPFNKCCVSRNSFYVAWRRRTSMMPQQLSRMSMLPKFGGSHESQRHRKTIIQSVNVSCFYSDKDF